MTVDAIDDFNELFARIAIRVVQQMCDFDYSEIILPYFRYAEITRGSYEKFWINFFFFLE